ncbi:MAG: nuclear transport factor 2 family protein [Gammaproteobacteria bacterium]|nr:nuclear transport factor 2 family protein [Gammaproteobacteria bacterium]
MRHLTVLATLILLMSVATADLAAVVWCQETSFSQSVEDRDIEAFKSFLDDDARFVGNTVLRGRVEIVAAWQVFFSDDGPAIKWRPQFVEVLKDGNLALTRGPYRMLAKDADGTQVERWGTFNSVWRKKSNGEWHVVFDAGDSAASPPDEETQAILQHENDC